MLTTFDIFLLVLEDAIARFEANLEAAITADESQITEPASPEDQAVLLSQAHNLAAATSSPRFEERNRDHAQSLPAFGRNFDVDDLSQLRRVSMRIAYVVYLRESVKAFVFTCFFAPITIVGDPISTLATFVIYPIIYIFLGLSLLALWIFDLFDRSKFIFRITKRRRGLSSVQSTDHGFPIKQSDTKAFPINFDVTPLLENTEKKCLNNNVDPIFNDATKRSIKSALPTLSGGLTTIPAVVEDACATQKTTRIFDLDVAKTCLALSSLVYSRNEASIKKAVREASSGNYKEAELSLMQSVETIQRQAQDYNLRFESIADLGSAQGANGNVFYSARNSSEPFMILVFKGTTPSNYAEFLVDCTLTRVDARGFYAGGTIHEGFATHLFPLFEPAKGGYCHLLQQLKRIAGLLKQERKESGRDIDSGIPLWVTGHSLGAALASLFFARALRAADDLTADIHLRDCYAFGSPRVGDAAFAGEVDVDLLKTVDRANIMWRIQNRSDIVTSLPPNAGFGDDLRWSSIVGAPSILNYCHIGVAFNLLPQSRDKCFKVNSVAFHNPTNVVIKQDTSGEAQTLSNETARDSCYKANKTKLGYALSYLMPRFIFDHRAEAYMHSLCQIVTDNKAMQPQETSPQNSLHATSIPESGSDSGNGYRSSGSSNQHDSD